jgi:hypothetical protein
MRPVAPFRPGHDRWNLVHSLASRPDVISDLHPTEDEARYVATLGYEPGPSRMLVLRETARIDRRKLDLAIRDVKP